MPLIEELPTTSANRVSHGWAYVPDTGPTKAILPPGSRKRGAARDGAVNKADGRAKQAKIIQARLADLDKENYKDTTIPIPSRAKDKGKKITPNVRRILTYQRTFAHYLADEEAQLAQAGGSNTPTATTTANKPNLPRTTGLAVGPTAAASARTSSRAQQPPMAPPPRPRTSSTLTPSSLKRESSSVDPPTPTKEAPQSQKSAVANPRPPPSIGGSVALLPVNPAVDNDPLLKSHPPKRPSARVIEALLSELPLTYNAARAKPPEDGPPVRHFCAICGYWGKLDHSTIQEHADLCYRDGGIEAEVENRALVQFHPLFESSSLPRDMPLNTLRLNHQASTHPNDRIVFIKPLPRPASDQASYDLADTFLRAIAAQCLPIMKKHCLSVTTLEEFEPNPEFIGRNFNNGEVIQLVLRSKNGGWVPFNFVQMVMMHELAHNTHMNHGKGFWAERNKLSGELRELWAKRYTGEGFWGNGQSLQSLQAVAGSNTIPSQELADLHVCGGTFRSRGRKRKRAGGQQDLTWKEKRDKRIEKKFGKNGQALGEDEMTRMTLEVGKKGSVGGKPRVASSKRGRELRAAAALARFGTNKAEEEITKEEEPGDSSEYGSEYEDVDVKGEDAKDVNGQKLLDSMGFGMLRVCGDKHDSEDEVQVKQEMGDLMKLDLRPNSQAGAATRPSRAIRITPASKPEPPRSESQTFKDVAKKDARADAKRNPLYDIPQYRGSPSPDPLSSEQPKNLSGDTILPSVPSGTSSKTGTVGIHGPDHPRKAEDGKATDPTSPSRELLSSEQLKNPTHNTVLPCGPSGTSSKTGAAGIHSQDHPPKAKDENATYPTHPAIPSTINCPICSTSNDRLNPTCDMCGHVLDRKKVRKPWRCRSGPCLEIESQYVNAGDTKYCGACGNRRSYTDDEWLWMPPRIRQEGGKWVANNGEDHRQLPLPQGTFESDGDEVWMTWP